MLDITNFILEESHGLLQTKAPEASTEEPGPLISVATTVGNPLLQELNRPDVFTLEMFIT